MSAAPPSLAGVLAAPHALATLGLPLSTALTDAEVRAAYRVAALAFHPDKLAPSAQSDPLTVQSHASAFIRVCEAFQAVKNADDRWKLIQQVRETEIWNEMKVKEAQEAAARAAAPHERQTADHARAPRRKQPHASAAGGTATSTPTAAPAPSGAFPSFAGARFRPSAHTFRTNKAAPGGRAPPAAAAAASAADRPFGSSGAAAASARASAATYDDPSSSSPVGVTRAVDADSLRAELTRWKMRFEADMASERDRSTQALLDRFAGARALGALQSQLGGAAIFTQAALPQRCGAASNHDALVPKPSAGGSVQPTAAVAVAAGASSATTAPIPSRLQQMRDRQRGMQTAPSTAAAPSSSGASASSAPAALSAAHTALLTGGARFRLRTVAVTPLSRPAAPRSSVPAPAPTSGPVAISLWLDSSLSLLQYRLVSSPHSHPDGGLAVSSLASLRRLAKPVGDCWFSLVQRDGQSMSLEAASPETRERWIAALDALIKSQR